jgi:ABC-type transport system substrate-binding protein
LGVVIRLLLAAIVASIAPQGLAADWADSAKVLKVALPIDVSGLDPAGTQEAYASVIEARIFDALYVWDYLARPYRFVPSIATGMPEISADGRIWTIHISIQRYAISRAHRKIFFNNNTICWICCSVIR